jgi:serine/threonine protein kinase
VYSAKDADDSEVALKIIRKDKGYSDRLSQKLVQNEMLVMSKLGAHPNIVNSLGCNPNGIAFLADGNHSIKYLILEWCKNGSLSNIIRQTGPLEEDIAKFLFLQLWYATQFIHNKNYAHLDIKLENILLDDYFNIKLADLGTAINICETMGFTDKKRGTLLYMAPEIKNKEKDDMIDATIADVYSLGVWLHLLLTGEFPSQSSMDTDFSSMQTETSAESNDLESDKLVKSRIKHLSDSAKDLLEEMLEDNPFFRMSIDEVFLHEWLKDFDYEQIQQDVYLEMSSRLEHIRASQSKQTE